MNDRVMQLLRTTAAKSDARLSKRAGFEKVDICTALESLIKHGRVEVGYRACCGHTDPTAHVHREWQKLLKVADKNGIRIAEEPAKHSNAYATIKGGFWHSSIYTLPASPEPPHG